MKSSYIVIPILTIFTATLGSAFTQGGMLWYKLILHVPPWTPSGTIIGIVWTVLYVLATISAIIVWNYRTVDLQMSLEVTGRAYRRKAIGGFVANALLNASWSFAFFTLHLVWLSIFIAALLAVSVLYIMMNAFPISAKAALLLLPYFLWASFATYLNYSIYIIN
jgi:tryptophan-rich sensory protein